MSHHSALDNPVMNLLPESLDREVLDVGCGYGIWTLMLRVKKGAIAQVTGLDIHIQYLQRLRKTKVYDHLVWADIRFIPFRPNSFSLVIASEILEHLNKYEGRLALEQILDLSPEIILTTPYGFMQTKGYDDNKHQRHLSGWSPQDFQARGLDTHVIDSVYMPRIVRLAYRIRQLLLRRPWWERKQIIAWRVAK